MGARGPQAGWRAALLDQRGLAVVVAPRDDRDGVLRLVGEGDGRVVDEHEVRHLPRKHREVLGVGGVDGAAVVAVEAEREQLAGRVEDVEQGLLAAG